MENEEVSASAIVARARSMYYDYRSDTHHEEDILDLGEWRDLNAGERAKWIKMASALEGVMQWYKERTQCTPSKGTA